MLKSIICQNVKKVFFSTLLTLNLKFLQSIKSVHDFRTKVNLNEISHNSAMGLVKKAIDNGVLLTEVSYFVLEKVFMYADNLSNMKCSQHSLNNVVPCCKGLYRHSWRS